MSADPDLARSIKIDLYRFRSTAWSGVYTPRSYLSRWRRRGWQRASAARARGRPLCCSRASSSQAPPWTPIARACGLNYLRRGRPHEIPCIQTVRENFSWLRSEIFTGCTVNPSGLKAGYLMTHGWVLQKRRRYRYWHVPQSAAAGAVGSPSGEGS